METSPAGLGRGRHACILEGVPGIVNAGKSRERKGAMQADRIRMAWFAALALSLGTAGLTPSLGQETQPAEVLKAEGLKRSSGSTWILAGEAAILKDVQKTRGLSSQLRGAQEQQQALEMGNQNPQTLIDGYRQQIDLMDQ